jgi:hypothetical protein
MPSRSFGGFPICEPLLLLELSREIGPWDVLRDDVTVTVRRAADILRGNDAGMIKVGDGAGFGEIRVGIFRLRDQLGVRHLDGHVPVQLLILSQIDKAEAPVSQDVLDPVATDPLRACSGRTLEAKEFAIMLEQLFASDRDGVPKGVIEVVR